MTEPRIRRRQAPPISRIVDAQLPRKEKLRLLRAALGNARLDHRDAERREKNARAARERAAAEQMRALAAIARLENDAKTAED
jgi:hypothetical protein